MKTYQDITNKFNNNNRVLIKKKKSKQRDKNDIIFCAIMLFYPLLMFLIFYVYVNLNSFAMAFQKIDFIGNKMFIGFNNFIDFFSRIGKDKTALNYAFINSLKVYIISLVVCMPLYLLFSFLLFKKCFLHKSMKLIFMVPQMVSAMVISLLFKKFVDFALPDIALNIFKVSNFPSLFADVNYVLGTCIFYTIWISFSISLIVYPNAMNAISDSVLESAQIDGVQTMFQELWYIVLPLIYPTISTFLILGFAGIFAGNLPLTTFYMYGSPVRAYHM